MHRAARIGMGLLGAVMGCSRSHPVDLAGGSPGALGGTAILREADDCWLRRVDGRDVPDRGMYGLHYVRSYRIASGWRTLTLQYIMTTSFAYFSNAPVEISLTLQPDHAYELRSSRTAFIGFAWDVGKIKPTVVDGQSKETVGTVQGSR